jgi:hypothetical protein
VVGSDVLSVEANGDIIGICDGAKDGDIEPSDGIVVVVVVVVGKVDGAAGAKEFAEMASDGNTVSDTDDWRGTSTKSCDGAGI